MVCLTSLIPPLQFRLCSKTNAKDFLICKSRFYDQTFESC